MPQILGLATVPGVTGVIPSFGLFHLAERVFRLDPETLRMFMYSKLSV